MICYQTFSWSMELINRLKLMPKIPMEKAIIIGMLFLPYKEQFIEYYAVSCEYNNLIRTDFLRRQN